MLGVTLNDRIKKPEISIVQRKKKVLEWRPGTGIKNVYR